MKHRVIKMILVDKNHKELLRDIRNYVDILTSPNLGALDFFIPHKYIDSKDDLSTTEVIDSIGRKQQVYIVSEPLLSYHPQGLR